MTELWIPFIIDITNSSRVPEKFKFPEDKKKYFQHTPLFINGYLNHLSYSDYNNQRSVFYKYMQFDEIKKTGINDQIFFKLYEIVTLFSLQELSIISSQKLVSPSKQFIMCSPDKLVSSSTYVILNENNSSILEKEYTLLSQTLIPLNAILQKIKSTNNLIIQYSHLYTQLSIEFFYLLSSFFSTSYFIIPSCTNNFVNDVYFVGLNLKSVPKIPLNIMTQCVDNVNELFIKKINIINVYINYNLQTMQDILVSQLNLQEWIDIYYQKNKNIKKDITKIVLLSTTFLSNI